MPTFYLAGSSLKRGELASRMVELGALGLLNQFNWTGVKVEEHPPGDPKNSSLVMRDLIGACQADIFVLHLHKDAATQGGWAELGARLSNDACAHVVMNGHPWHLFLDSRRITVHKDWASFLAWLRSSPWLAPGSSSVRAKIAVQSKTRE